MRYWVNAISRDHVLLGVQGGFTQAEHGRATRLKTLAKGDFIVFYSPRTAYPDGEPLQAFTALGSISDDEPYQVQMRADFHPWRRAVEFRKCTETAIQPLPEDLEFIPHKKHWGYPFRRGLFEVSRADFERLATAMHVTLPKA
jgi:hypothetical protein